MKEHIARPIKPEVAKGQARQDAPLRAGLSRRSVLKAGFWTSVGALLVSAGATIINGLYPRSVEPFGGPVAVPASMVPQPGAPPRQNFEGHFLLVNLKPNEGRIATDETPASGGLVALWWKCPHLGCTVPWKQDFITPKDALGRRGWFNCNCHGSTYTKAGVRVWGPASRSMDTMQLSVDPNGNVTVQTGKRTNGDLDNPQRAVPWPPSA